MQEKCNVRLCFPKKRRFEYEFILKLLRHINQKRTSSYQIDLAGYDAIMPSSGGVGGRVLLAQYTVHNTQYAIHITQHTTHDRYTARTVHGPAGGGVGRGVLLAHLLHHILRRQACVVIVRLVW